MKKTSSGRLGRIVRHGSIAAFILLCMVVFTSTAVFASAVNIYDNANVLNQSSVKRAASALSKPVDIYSVNSSMSNTAFDQAAKNNASKDSNLIVMAFNGNHVSIVGGNNVPLSTGQYQDAVNAFTGKMRGGNANYTNATVAALNSLQGSLRGAENNGGLIPGPGAIGRSGSIFNGTFCCVGLIVLLAIAMFAITRARRRNIPASGPVNYSRTEPYGTPNQPYGAQNQPYGTPNQPYGTGYPQNQYGQGPNMPGNRGGMNPLAAGGIGAALGGLFGYGLGKESDRDHNPAGGEGGVGSGASGDFGGADNGGLSGGASGDYGNSGGGASGDYGSSDAGSFGGGASGGFGGDSDGGDDDSGSIGGGAGGNF